MSTAATLPDALSDSARTFAAGPHRLVIGGERPDAADGRTFETFDPATGQPIAEVPYAGAEDVDRAVRAGVDLQISGHTHWRSSSRSTTASR